MLQDRPTLDRKTFFRALFAAIDREEVDSVNSLLEQYPNMIAAEKAGWFRVLTHLFYRPLTGNRKKEPCSVEPTAILRALIAHGADLTVCDSAGTPVIFLAAGYGYTECVRLLMDNGADVNSVVSDGKTLLIFITYLQRKSLVQLLLAYRADVNRQTALGTTALALARKNENTDLIQLLEQAGARK
jgi:hypothetical protein